MENKRKFRPAPGIKLMDQVRQVLHFHHYAYQTEKTFCSWIEQYVRFHKWNKHPREMGKVEIESFLSHLATNRSVSASTQRQALNAVAFLYKHVLGLPSVEGICKRTLYSLYSVVPLFLYFPLSNSKLRHYRRVGWCPYFCR